MLGIGWNPFKIDRPQSTHLHICQDVKTMCPSVFPLNKHAIEFLIRTNIRQHNNYTSNAQKLTKQTHQ